MCLCQCSIVINRIFRSPGQWLKRMPGLAARKGRQQNAENEIMIHYNDVPIYPIVLSENFDALGEALDDLMIKDRKVCIVTDSHVADFYLEQVEHIVKEHCAAASHFIFPAGEESKTLTTV